MSFRAKKNVEGSNQGNCNKNRQIERTKNQETAE